MNKIVITLMLLLVMLTPVFAHDEPHPPDEVGESIVNIGLSCDDLDEEQIIAVGVHLYGDSKFQWWLKLRTYIGYCWSAK